MNLVEAQKFSAGVLAALTPYCQVDPAGNPMIQVAGSIRRGRPNPNDVDIVLLPRDIHAIKDRMLVRCDQADADGAHIKRYIHRARGFQIDLYIASPEDKDLFGNVRATTFGAMLLCRTGSKDFNIWYSRQADAAGFRWSSTWGLYKGNERVAGATEEEMFTALGLSWINPEDRER